MNILDSGKIPIKSWASDIEEGALIQAKNLAELAFAFKHIAIMPDVHEGYGMPIGGVLACKGMIIPNAVGVDIGCGLMAIKTDIREINRDDIKKLVNTAYKLIPSGFRHHKKPQLWDGFKNAPETKIFKQELESAKRQIGSLGGGNHFCSIEQGSDGQIWLMIHSGSRNLGYKVANYYNEIAKKINEKTCLVPKNFDLSPLDMALKEGREYFDAMNYCLEFAKANREMLFHQFYGIFQELSGSKEILQKIDIHHNYASMESHFGEEVIVHRKGATRARQSELGIIPGSMGTPSYIVEGLGNTESFMSCSHGCGRVMGRKQANRTFTEEMANKAMEGIYYKDWKGDYAEAPMAYKDIEEIMENQKELVKALVKLTPLGVMKG